MKRVVTIHKRLLTTTVLKKRWGRVCAIDTPPYDWRTEIIKFLQDPYKRENRRFKAIQYFWMEGDLYKKSLKDDVVLKCLNGEDAVKMMREVHEGVGPTNLEGRPDG